MPINAPVASSQMPKSRTAPPVAHALAPRFDRGDDALDRRRSRELEAAQLLVVLARLVLGRVGDAQRPQREAGAAEDDRPDQQLARRAVRRARNGCVELEVERAVQPARVLGVRAGGMTGAERHDLDPPRARVGDHRLDERAAGTAPARLREHREPAQVRGRGSRASTTRRRPPPRPRHRPRTTPSRPRGAGAGGAFQSGASAIGAPNSASTDRATARHASTSAAVAARTPEPA